MEKRIVECVPNFSEGRDKAIIRQITSAIESSGGVKLLDVDPGEATNRTVVTFVGSPEAVVEAAFAGVKRAAELIDMRRHKGAHPRMGATDVLPLIPICGITLAECAELARKLAERIAAELHVPTYCYEAAAFIPERRNLADENVHALRDAHVHDAALYGTLAMQTNNLAGLADLDFFQCLHWFFLLIS